MHTKEPWIADGRLVEGNADGHRYQIASMDDVPFHVDGRFNVMRDNAKRAVACVNALAGRDTAALAELEAAICWVLNNCELTPSTVGCHRSELAAALAKFRRESR